MKRLSSSDSLGGFMSICQTSTVEHSQENSHVYSREFQSMLEGFDEEGCVEESGYVPEKKRRLSGDQVKALEKNFEVENKLEPERKVKLAQELGLQPRQVAVWFQNRRARWKTKQLERDYGVLKANYDALKHSYDKLHLENNVLIQEIDELKSKLQDDKCEHNVSVKEVAQANHLITENDDQEEEEAELNYENFNSKNGLNLMGVTLFTNFKDRSSDSDSSAILNEDISPIAASSGGGIFQDPNGLFNNSNRSSSLSMSGLQISDTKSVIIGDAHKVYDEPLFVKIEEHKFFSGDESCSTFFSDDQPPSLQWDCPEEWN